MTVALRRHARAAAARQIKQQCPLRQQISRFAQILGFLMASRGLRELREPVSI
jgi:hypothetical protein